MSSLASLRGYRAWRLHKDEFQTVLASVFANSLWYPKHPKEARCGQFHPAPQEDCHCGLYYVNDLETLAEEDPKRRLVSVVVGTVEVWGNMVQHEHGGRAQYAYPVNLIGTICYACRLFTDFGKCYVLFPSNLLVCESCLEPEVLLGGERVWSVIKADNEINELRKAYGLC